MECEHPACECDDAAVAMMLENGRKYCSDYCRSEATDEPQAKEFCACGHIGCSTQE